MIGLASPTIQVNATQSQLMDFLKNPEISFTIYQHQHIKQFKYDSSGFSFILKKCAAFNYRVKIPNKEQVLFASRNGAPFDSFLIFKLPCNGELIIEFESDTSGFMDYFMHSKIEDWLNSIATNILNHFNKI